MDTLLLFVSVLTHRSEFLPDLLSRVRAVPPASGASGEIVRKQISVVRLEKFLFPPAVHLAA